MCACVCMHVNVCVCVFCPFMFCLFFGGLDDVFSQALKALSSTELMLIDDQIT